MSNDNFVSILDLGILINSYNKTSTDPGYNPLADLNGDNFISILDLGLLIFNYNKLGEQP